MPLFDEFAPPDDDDDNNLADGEEDADPFGAPGVSAPRDDEVSKVCSPTGGIGSMD